MTSCFDEKAYQKQYRIDNRDKILAKKRQWRADNIEIIKAKEEVYRDNNREYLRRLNKEWRKNNPEKMSIYYRRRNLKIKYGLTMAQFEQMVVDQNGVCAICECPETLEGRPLSVDHNHTTGEIRGLLCNDCNRNLIAQRDDPEIFLRAAEYIRKKV